mmetsp:Transcript_14556/g.26375  ORF Transcript_14556/g.26375 Transcript_14556/m.26375 type:complete len:250 (-) Transcript_14556:128-877(-)|eukprot:CAMPEP_0201866444 /NCGR_PEP_ID=MMETSP0902-20130614/1038_1 /ASSEMBLY_ACC=CAM_ASM_000551 /TAXON_ID=420261 /ORGANISM="Thalassiosira antarctica, Strain CCMP982" /LENGTH=249 /DNA_ID=CAMNT_0048391423 /DNA_START=78 /DNA_END=827 /DNA_ORIENTATION=+
MGRGKLVFKGGEKAKKKKKSSSARNKPDGGSHLSLSAAGGGGEVLVGAVTSSSTGPTQQPDAALAPTHEGSHADAYPIGDGQKKVDLTDETQNPGPKINSGQGLMTTSQCVCRGHGTAFKTELRAGDAIIARTENGAEEMRVITMVLSQVSISISSSFSSDLRIPTPWRYINKPRDDKKLKAAQAQKARQEKEEVETRAMGTYGNNGEIIYREKTVNGGYRIRKEQATTEMSRSDLMAVRATKKSDRYC